MLKHEEQCPRCPSSLLFCIPLLISLLMQVMMMMLAALDFHDHHQESKEWVKK